MNGGRRPRLLVFNQYYWPAVEATAHLLTELCEGLADEYDITVVAGAHPDSPSGRTKRNGVLILRGLVGAYLRGADRIVAIGDTMRGRLEAKGADPRRVRVIPNWVDTALLVPKPRDNEWSRGKRLHRRFVVMHSGNIGHAQDL